MPPIPFDPQGLVALNFLSSEGTLIGTVIETETLRSLEVYACFVNVETAAVLAAEDVYGEDLTPRNVKTLMAGLALKLKRHFPLAEGVIMAKEGQTIWVDLTKKDGIKPGMKLILFREGKHIERGGRTLQMPASLLGEAWITVVSTDLSEARLLSSAQSEEVRESDRVMTK